MSKPALRFVPDEMDAGWFTDVLRNIGHDVTVDSVTSRPIGIGQSAHSERFTLSYRGDAGAAPSTVVGKLPAPDPTSRATGHNHGSYAREIGFYQDLEPTVAIPTPQCFYLDFNPENSDFVLLLEDLAPAEQGDQMAGCDVATAEAAMRAVAGLHGPRFGDATLLDYPIFAAARAAARAAAGADQPPLFNMFWNEFVGRYDDRLSPEIRELGEAFLEHYPAYASEYPGPKTLIHGDYRLDNLLIGGPASAPSVHAVDWQTVNIGCAAHDVAYFIGAGLQLDDRRRSEESLVRHWLDALGDYGVTDYSFAQAWDDYRWSSFAGYVMAVIASILVVRTERGDDMFMVMAHRHGQQAIDLEALDLIAHGR